MNLKSLPLANYPQVAPPSVSISAFYPGADANTVSESVAAVLEREINGAEGMIYISSKCFNNGKLSMTVTFDVDRDADLALVDVQNRVATAEAQLPQEVMRQGVTVKKQSPDMLMLISLYSPNGTVSDLDLANYAARTIQDELGRIPGVGDVGLAGAGDYGMRLWLNPEQMEFYDITVSDVRNAVDDQNRLAPGGSFGQAPMNANVQLERTAQIKGRLTTPEEFKQIILRTNDDGSVVYLGSITPDMVQTGADGKAITKPGVELGAANYASFSRFNGKPSTSLIIYQLPSGNAVEISEAAKVKLNALRETLQKSGTDIDYVIGLDMADFVRASLEELVHTFAEAILLVLVVVYLFLGSLRSTIVPLLAVPVSLIGVFAFFPMLGLSINNLTLFALVLAVGIVVDDAIVVVEAVEVHLEKGKSPYEASILAMNDVGFTIIGITCALVAVFLPLTMLGGLTGRLYEQFALTLSISIAISALTSLTLSPALCALVLKSKNDHEKPFVLVRLFNRFYGMLFNGYSAWVGTMVRRGSLTIILFIAIYVGMGGAMHLLPSSLVPPEDQRVFFMTLQMPNGTSQNRTLEVSNALVKELLEAIPEIESVATLGGTQLATGAQSSSVASLIVLLTNWDERTGPGQDAMTLINKAQALATAKFQGPMVMAFNVPTISGLGIGAGLTLEVENTGANTAPEVMMEPVGKLYQAFMQTPELNARGTFTAFSMEGRVTRLEVDREKAKSQGVSLSEVFDTINTFLGGSYINDFQEFGRTYQVMMQAQSEFRAEEKSLQLFYLRNKYGELTPASSIITAVDTNGPEFLTRYNLYPNVEFMSAPAPGYSSGEAMDAMMAKAKAALPTGFGFEWTGQSYQEQLAAGQTQVVIALAFICCFLVLAGLYESLISPLVVMFSVPIAILGALLGQLARGLTLDVFMQVGLVMLIGLAAKNAILIVQFAQERQKEGHPLVEAAILAGKERLRPILMTSFAFILGVLPLVFASGAGANARHSLGTPVFAGMIVATGVGVFAIPGLYALAQKWFGKKSQEAAPK